MGRKFMSGAAGADTDSCEEIVEPQRALRNEFCVIFAAIMSCAQTGWRLQPGIRHQILIGSGMDTEVVNPLESWMRSEM